VGGFPSLPDVVRSATYLLGVSKKLKTCFGFENGCALSSDLLHVVLPLNLLTYSVALVRKRTLPAERNSYYI
jgi:hypothetical protein